MNRLNFSITINADKEKIWKVLLDDETYRQWTSAFCEGSSVKTDWREGSKALFLGPDGHGMVSRIAVHRPNDYLEIEHLGVVKDGVEDTDSEAVKEWVGALETYRIQQSNGTSTLSIESDISDQYKESFLEIWPKALQKLKELAEKK